MRRDPYQLAEDQLVDQVNNGEISQREFNEEMRAMAREIRAEAEQAAQDAYDDTMNRHGFW